MVLFDMFFSHKECSSIVSLQTLGLSDLPDQEVLSGLGSDLLVSTLFWCADDFLRQELTDKMIMCQYAVTFILCSYGLDLCLN